MKRRKKNWYRKWLAVFMVVAINMAAVFPGNVSYAENTELTNVAMGKTVTQQYNGGTAGGTEGATEPLVDGSKNRAKYWDGGDAPASFTIDLGQEYEIEKFVAFPYWDDVPSRYYNYVVYTSSDGEEFTEAVSKTDNMPETENGTEYVLSQVITARYIKVEMNNSSVGSAESRWVHMVEFEVYGREPSVQYTPQISLNKSSIKIPVNTTELLKALGTDEWGKPISQGINWSSSDETVAVVDETGCITAKAVGETVITAVYGSTDIAAFCNVRVFDPEEEEIRKELKNVALNKPVTASVPTSAERNPLLITDGDRTNYWDGGDGPADFTIDLGEEYEIEKMVAYPYFGDGRYYRYEIYCGIDGINYKKIAEKIGAEPETETGTMYEFDEPISMRYVQVKMISNNINNYVHMNEFEVYARTYVEPVETEITVNKQALRMPAGSETVLKAEGSDKWGQEVSDLVFASSDSAIAAVDENGTVSAISSGCARIVISSEACGKVLDVNVEVYDPAAVEDELKIMVYWPPTGDYTTEEQYDYIREANFNRVMGTYAADLSSTAAIMKIAGLCADRGMEFIAGEAALGDKTSLEGDIVKAVVDTYKYVPGIGGFHLKDEPYPGTEIEYVNMLRLVKEAWPEAYPHINLLASLSYEITQKDFEQSLNAFAAEAGSNLEYLMFDYYPFGPDADSFDAERMFQNLDTVRRLGLKHNIKTSTFIQSVGHEGMRCPNGTEIGYEVALALAYGYKQLAYFSYFQPVGQDFEYTPAIMDAEGNKTALYDSVKEINRQVMNLSPVLVHLDAVEVWHSGKTDGQEPIPDDSFVQVTGDNDVLVSHMKDKETGKEYLMVVNKDFVNAQKITLSFDETINAVSEIGKDDGNLHPVEMNDDLIEMGFTAGEGKLLALSRGEKVDKSILNEVISETEGLEEEEYTLDSWMNLQQILSDARTVSADRQASREQVEKVVEKLQNVLAKLKKSGDPAELIKLLYIIDSMEKEGYTSDSVENLLAVVDVSQKVVDKRGTQDEIDAAITALEAAKKA